MRLERVYDQIDGFVDCIDTGDLMCIARSWMYNKLD